MRNYLFAIPAAFILAFSISSFALDTDTISFIHSKTKSAMFDICKKKMIGYTDAICSCIGDKAAANLDDQQLAQCSDHSRRCMQQVVENASIAALASDSIQACVNQSANNTTAAPQPSLTPGVMTQPTPPQTTK